MIYVMHIFFSKFLDVHALDFFSPQNVIQVFKIIQNLRFKLFIINVHEVLGQHFGPSFKVHAQFEIWAWKLEKTWMCMCSFINHILTINDFETYENKNSRDYEQTLE